MVLRTVSYGKSGNWETKKKKDPEERRKNRNNIHQPKYKGKRKGFRDVMWKDNQKLGIFKITKRMIAVYEEW